MKIGEVKATLMAGETTIILSRGRRPTVRIDPRLIDDDELIYEERIRRIISEDTGPEVGFYGLPQLRAIADLVGGKAEIDPDYLAGLDLDGPPDEGKEY